MMTVFVLAVLWLIVVVPMVVRRNDELRRERSVNGFGRAMRALGRQVPIDAAEMRNEVFVPRTHRDERARANARAEQARPEARSGARSEVPVHATRRPVPSAQEALMFPVDRSDMSAARHQMMKRRRRSLTILVGGTAIFGLLSLVMGGAMWLLAAPFTLGLGGYVFFLRTQAIRDRERRANRLERTTERRTTGIDVTEEIAHFEEAPQTMVRIDDDDLELHAMDTIDLTGMYEEELAAQATSIAQRRAS